MLHANALGNYDNLRIRFPSFAWKDSSFDRSVWNLGPMIQSRTWGWEWWSILIREDRGLSSPWKAPSSPWDECTARFVDPFHYWCIAGGWGIPPHTKTLHQSFHSKTWASNCDTECEEVWPDGRRAHFSGHSYKPFDWVKVWTPVRWHPQGLWRWCGCHWRGLKLQGRGRWYTEIWM